MYGNTIQEVKLMELSEYLDRFESENHGDTGYFYKVPIDFKLQDYDINKYIITLNSVGNLYIGRK